MGGLGTGAGGPIGEAGFDGGGTDSGGTGGTGMMGMAGESSGPRTSCGDTTCDALTQVCCAGLGGFGCIAEDQECNGAILTCSNADDCSGNTVCCLRVIGDVVGSSQCKASCQTMGMPQNRERQLCSTDAECPFEHCRPTVFGVSVCTRR
jgi:hypothetical protein